MKKLDFRKLSPGLDAQPAARLKWWRTIKVTIMVQKTEYKYLKPKAGSNYRQLFVNGRIRAEILYRETIGVEPLSPEKVAEQYGLPVDAILEAIDYCVHHQELLDADRAREEARIQAARRDQWPYAPRESKPEE
jgi:hypothetical protein